MREAFQHFAEGQKIRKGQHEFKIAHKNREQRRKDLTALFRHPPPVGMQKAIQVVRYAKTDESFVKQTTTGKILRIHKKTSTSLH